MNIHFYPVSDSTFFLKKKFLPVLTVLQKKILFIAVIAFACLTACYRIYSSKAKLKQVESDLEETDIKDLPKDLKPLYLLPEDNTDIDVESLPNSLSTLPSEIVLKIIGLLSVSDLERMTQVNTGWQEFIDKNENEIWSNLCQCEELEPKNSTRTWKEHYKKFYLSIPLLGGLPAYPTIKFKRLKLDTPSNFKQQVALLHLDQYQLLNPRETRLLFKKSDTIALIQNVSFHELQMNPPIPHLPDMNELQQTNIYTLRYVAQQQVGKINFDIISYTDVIVSFDSQRQLMINNEPTNTFMTKDDCQLLIYGYRDSYQQQIHLAIFAKDIGAAGQDTDCVRFKIR